MDDKKPSIVNLKKSFYHRQEKPQIEQRIPQIKQRIPQIKESIPQI